MVSYTNIKDKVSIDIKEKYSVDLYIGGKSNSDGALRYIIKDNELFMYKNDKPNRVFKVKKTNEDGLVNAINKEITTWINKDFLSVPKNEVAVAYVYYCDDLQYVYQLDNFLDDINRKGTLYDAKSYLKTLGKTNEEIDEEEKRLAIFGIRSNSFEVKVSPLLPPLVAGWLAFMGILFPGILREGGNIAYPSLSIVINLFDKLIDKVDTPLIFANDYAVSLVFDTMILGPALVMLREFANMQLNGRRSIKHYKEKLEKLENDPEKVKLLKKDFKKYIAGEKHFDNEKIDKYK